jgi:membrane-bound inhibitor of C-type lysozyme
MRIAKKTGRSASLRVTFAEAKLRRGTRAGRVACGAIAALSAVFLMASGEGASAVTASFRCADGAMFLATFSSGAGAGSATLAFGGSTGEITLPQVLSADGGRYADGEVELWVKGRRATLTRGGRSTTCEAR